MKQKKIILIVCVILLMLITIILLYINQKENIIRESIEQSKNTGAIKKPTITKENFPLYLENSQLVKDLPEDAIISLKFYNFNSGERQWEEAYIITKGKVQKGSSDNPDLEIIIHSKYIPELGNLCQAVKNAKANGDLAFWSNINTAKFLWKYRSMLKYKECFGL